MAFSISFAISMRRSGRRRIGAKDIWDKYMGSHKLPIFIALDGDFIHAWSSAYFASLAPPINIIFNITENRQGIEYSSDTDSPHKAEEMRMKLETQTSYPSPLPQENGGGRKE